MGMKEIITVKASKVQVGDIICGLGVPGFNRTTPPVGWSVPGSQDHWIPAHTVLEVEQTHQATPTQNATWWLVTESLEGQYVNELGPFGIDCELHVVKA